MSTAPTERPGQAGPATDDYGVASGPGELRLERVLPGPIERVWAYLTDSEKRGKWLAPGEMELRAGGPVELRFHHADLSCEKTPPAGFQQFECGVTLEGRVTRCEPPRLLSYSWGGGPDASEVTFELTPRGGEVLLVLTHRRLRDRTEMVSVASGWHSHLGLLADQLEGREPRPFWSTITRTRAEYDRRLPGPPAS
jgi:uncharacterized protein YndB with AHSA1/START domain